MDQQIRVYIIIFVWQQCNPYKFPANAHIHTSAYTPGTLEIVLQIRWSRIKTGFSDNFEIFKGFEAFCQQFFFFENITFPIKIREETRPLLWNWIYLLKQSNNN